MVYLLKYNKYQVRNCLKAHLMYFLKTILKERFLNSKILINIQIILWDNVNNNHNINKYYINLVVNLVVAINHQVVWVYHQYLMLRHLYSHKMINRFFREIMLKIVYILLKIEKRNLKLEQVIQIQSQLKIHYRQSHLLGKLMKQKKLIKIF